MVVTLIDKGYHLETFGNCFYYCCEPHCRIDNAEDKGLFTGSISLGSIGLTKSSQSLLMRS